MGRVFVHQSCLSKSLHAGTSRTRNGSHVPAEPWYLQIPSSDRKPHAQDLGRIWQDWSLKVSYNMVDIALQMQCRCL